MRFLTCAVLALPAAAAASAAANPVEIHRAAAIATESTKGGPRTGLVTRHSLAIAACRTAAARYGKLVGNKVRLLDRHTFLITGVVTPPTGGAAREVPDPVRKQQHFSCKVTDTGKVLDHTIGALPPRQMKALPPAAKLHR